MFAAATSTQAATCMLTDITPTALACTLADKNVVSNSAAHVTAQQSALAILGFNWDGANWNGFEKLNASGSSVDFNTQLFGITFVAFHFGGSSAVGNSTAFYKFDAGSGAGLDTIGINISALSNAIVYSTGIPTIETGGVPEPATWAMMIVGLGGLGSLIRRRRAASAIA
jgi:hypothetical protein